MPGGDPARCASGQTLCEKYIDSATEIAESDGARFRLDAGHRVLVRLESKPMPLPGAHSGIMRNADVTKVIVSDPDIFQDGQAYRLSLSHGPNVSVWTSDRLQGEFVRAENPRNGLLVSSVGGVPAGHFDAASRRYWTYTHIRQGAVSVIRHAVHVGLDAPLDESRWTVVLSGASLGLGTAVSVESPGFAVNRP